jgi:hypothetical protein
MRKGVNLQGCIIINLKVLDLFCLSTDKHKIKYKNGNHINEYLAYMIYDIQR